MLAFTSRNSGPATDTAASQNGKWEHAFRLCLQKTHANIRRLADEPKSGAFSKTGNYFEFDEGFFEISNWTSSFFTGMALMAWREAEDDFFLAQTLRLAPWYKDKVSVHHAETMHDLGFLYSLYSVAIYKLTGDESHRDVGLRAAEVLAQRFIENGNYIRAWGRMDEADTDYAGLAIIDCMMNLPLLHWAARESGNQKFYDIAVRHADTTLRYFVRPDDSVFHSYRFDPQSGKPIGGDNYCGRSVDSHWARGAAWAIYGFALSYSYTNDAKYLSAALNLAKKFVSCLDAEIVPVWDFKLPDNEPPLRDSSAAAIAVCGFQELSRHQIADSQILSAKKALLDKISSDDYINFDQNCPGILKNAEVGDGVGKARTAYTSWGDYFLMEALAFELFEAERFW
ncbi:MAG TPA: glycoside hydrolase family 88 protein [Verrucomicrobiae bacterium]|nr:glycoside hydrolase family 88 protein [Verrucomicrobiae bacterium]